MKLANAIVMFLILCVFSSCDNSLTRKKLDLKSVENADVLIEKYGISEITTVHQFIDITNKRSSKTERILEANDHSVDSVFIKQDTLFLQKTVNQPIIYDLAAIKFGYKIVLLEPKN